MSENELFTLKEASFILQQTEASIDKYIASGVVAIARSPNAKPNRRYVTWQDLRFMHIAAPLTRELTLAGRRRLHEAIRLVRPDRSSVVFGRLILDLGNSDEELRLRLKDLDMLRASVEHLADSPPTLKGTKISVYSVAALLRGHSFKSVVERSSLTRKQIEIASQYAKIYPNGG